MGKIILHLGGPKAGSSALQAFFNLNQKVLMNSGVNYPLPNKSFPQPYQTSSGNSALFISFIEMENRKKAINYLERQLSQKKDLLLSSEHFFRICGEKEKIDLLFEILNGYEYECIVYIRPFDEVVNSLLNQGIKNHNAKNVLNKAIEDTNLWYGERVKALLDKKDVGAKILFRPYSASLFKSGDIYSDFLHFTKLELKGDIKYPEKYVNPSLSKEALELKRIINNMFYESVSLKNLLGINEKLADFSVDQKRKGNNKKFMVFDKNTQQRLEQENKPIYDRLYKEYSELEIKELEIKANDYEYITLRDTRAKELFAVLEMLLEENELKEMLAVKMIEKFYTGDDIDKVIANIKTGVKLNKFSTEIECIKKHEGLDTKYYLKNYKDVGDDGIDPLMHYCEYGWKEGRNPNAKFDTKRYLELHSDVAKAGINPLYHYLNKGKKEGRKLK